MMTSESAPIQEETNLFTREGNSESVPPDECSVQPRSQETMPPNPSAGTTKPGEQATQKQAETAGAPLGKWEELYCNFLKEGGTEAHSSAAGTHEDKGQGGEAEQESITRKTAKI